MKMVPLGEVLTFAGVPERIREPASESFITVRMNGGGAVKRNIKDGKTPLAFTGFRVRQGQFIYSRIDARNGAFALVPDELDGAVVSKDFPIFDIREDIIDSRYLIYFLNAGVLQREIRSSSLGATNRQRINEDRFLNFSLPLPSIGEQRRITAILELADTLRNARRAVLDSYEALRQSILVDMFGNPATNPHGLLVGTIKDLVETTDYGTSEKSYPEGDIAVLRMNNLTYSGDIDLTDLKYMTLAADKYARYTVRAGDVLFNRTNSAELVGKTAVYREEKPMAYAGYLVRLRVKAGFSPDYLSGVLNSRYGKATLRGMCKSIVGMANINAKEVQTIRTLIPPAAAQQLYGERLNVIRAHASQHSRALQQLDELFTSLQSRAFRGEL